MNNDDDLPEWMQTPEMRQAMSTLVAISEDESRYALYERRKKLHDEEQAKYARFRQMEAQLVEERAAREKAESDAAQERLAKEAILAEIERLKARLDG